MYIDRAKKEIFLVMTVCNLCEFAARASIINSSEPLVWQRKAEGHWDVPALHLPGESWNLEPWMWALAAIQNLSWQQIIAVASFSLWL